MKLSVIICTHNPKQIYLTRVLAALRQQTLSVDTWELILIDNASDRQIIPEIDLSWHSQSRCIREEKLGLTHARLRGMAESKAETLIFVDDDNVLDIDYLEMVLQISRNWPMLGVWGGQTIPEFEETPPDWTKPYLGMLGLREFERDRWSNLIYEHETTPIGAGICVRRIVAEAYTELLRNDTQRSALGRSGNKLTSGEDFDLALTACDIGLGKGIFTSLKLTHLIPASRLQKDYLLRLTEGLNYSGIWLAYFHGQLPQPPSFKSKVRQFYKRCQMDSITRRFYDASQRGVSRAIKEISSLGY